jgi:hypothetical protein
MLSEVVVAIKEKAGGVAGSVPNWEFGAHVFHAEKDGHAAVIKSTEQ